MSKENLKKNFIYQIVYRVLTVATPLITSPILSRALGAEKLGIFSATLALVGYFKLYSMLGIENYGNRSIASAQGDKKKLQELFWNIYSVQFFSTITAIVAYALAFLFIPRDRWLISVVQGLWLLSCLFDINWFFFGTEQFKLTVTRNIVIKCLTVALIALFVKTPDDLVLYAFIISGDAVLSNLILLPFLKRNAGFEFPTFAKIKEHIKPSFILFIPVLAMTVFHVMDKSMLDWLSTEEQLGYYYSADKVIGIPLGLITALSTVMLPRVSNEFSKGRFDAVEKMLKKSTEVTLCITLAAGVGVASIAKEFVPVFFGPGFEPCIKLLYLFVLVLFMKAIGGLVRSQYMIPAKKDKLYSMAIIIGAFTNLVSNYFLISRYSAIGAVLGTLIAETTVTVSEIVFTRNEVPFLSFFKSNMFYIVPAFVMFFVVRYLAHILMFPAIINLCLMIFAGVIIYLSICKLIWIFKKDSVFHAFNLKNIRIK